MVLLDTAAFKLVLPPEIWRMVLHSFWEEPRDDMELWTGCRGVSKFFKHEVEELFIANYLPFISLTFDMTTSQSFNQNRRIKFNDYMVETKYSRVSGDRTGAIFQADCAQMVKLLQQMHTEGCPAPKHRVDYRRPSDDVALPGVFFHANGDVEVGWRELFAAVFAEEKYQYRKHLEPFSVSEHLSLKGFTVLIFGYRMTRRSGSKRISQDLACIIQKYGLEKRRWLNPI